MSLLDGSVPGAFGSSRTLKGRKSQLGLRPSWNGTSGLVLLGRGCGAGCGRSGRALTTANLFKLGHHAVDRLLPDRRRVLSYTGCTASRIAS